MHVLASLSALIFYYVTYKFTIQWIHDIPRLDNNCSFPSLDLPLFKSIKEKWIWISVSRKKKVHWSTDPAKAQYLDTP